MLTSARLLSLAIGMCSLIAISGPAKAASRPAVTVQTAGPAETVYNWSAHACTNRETIPDTNARAYRDAQGQVHLFAPNSINWSMAGRSLDSLSVVCASAARGSESPDPSKFDDSPWIEATYTLDGRTVYALASNEFSTWRHRNVPGMFPCTTQGMSCLYYGITVFVSHDSGAHFTYPPGNHLAASLPFTFKPIPNRKGSTGIATTSNIVARDHFYYALLGVRAGLGLGEWKTGSCLVRTANLADPGSWRGWDGQAFNVRFPNPYSDAAAASQSPPCAPVYPDEEIGGVVFAPQFGLYIGTVRGWVPDDSGHKVPGIAYITSPDLIHWSDERLLMPLLKDTDCREFIVYPSIIDPTSDSRNFETIGSRPYLYFTRFNRTSACANTVDNVLNRDLVRVPLKISGG